MIRLGRRAAILAALGHAGDAAARRHPEAPAHAYRDFAPSLAGFFAALAATEERHGGPPVSVVQIGDSHTAGDFLSARLRELFQQRFGAAGRGMLPPGLADRYFNPRLVRVRQSERWQSANARAPVAADWFGIAGVTQQTAAAHQTMSLESAEPDGFDTAYVELLHRPDGGTARLRVDDGPTQVVATRARGAGSGWAEIPARPGSRTLSLETVGDGVVEVLSWGTERRRAGVLWQNFGLIGATVGALGNVRPEVVRAEFAHRRPSLIVVAFGTNEAFGRAADLDGYADMFAARVRDLHRAAPVGTAVLAVGPPDVNRRELEGREVVGRACGDGWVRPNQLDAVIAAQRSACARMGWTFWDWSRAMGGACAMARWTAAADKLGRDDHVHMQPAGYDRSAELLFADLMANYENFRAARAR